MDDDITQDVNRANRKEEKTTDAEGLDASKGGNAGPQEAHAEGGEAGEGDRRPMTIEEAARKGGNTTKERYGPDFYSRIGRKGGQRVAKERGPEFYSEIGRKGGEARVAQSRRMEREQGDEGKQE